ncbi:MAG: acetate kinase [Planctomycetota bacterium]|jgi:acetate kinase
MLVLVINCGSSSIKYQLFQMPERTDLASGQVERIGIDGSNLSLKVDGQKHEFMEEIKDHAQGMTRILETLVDEKVGVIKDIHEIRAVGHRVVHGGEAYSGSVIIDDDVLATIKEYCALAPLHNPANLQGIEAASSVLPSVPQIAVFDTAFHQTMPQKAFMYALPYEMYEKNHIRRYGFHGTSHAYVAAEASKMLGKDPENTNVITCHLGNGGSITAVKHGKCVDTSMGLTPLEGLVMGTRSGDLDPAIIFHLMDSCGYSCEEINTLLNKKSGLLGISGLTNDMRDLVEAAQKGNEQAKLAIDIFCYRIRKYIGAYMVVLSRVDAVVFTGGIGENNSLLRRDILSGLAGFHIEIDDEKNDVRADEERDIATDGSATRILVIPTDEEGYIANDAYRLATS